MKNSSFLNRLILIALLTLTSSCANSETSTDKLLADISKDLKNGLSVIVFQMTNKDKSSEQYADWSAYLNDFIASKPGKYKVYETNAAFNKKLTNSEISSNSDFTIFIKQDSETYYYDGVIVEPMVYMAVDNQFNKKKVTDMDRAFMPDAVHFALK